MSDLFVDNIKHQSSQGSGTITLGTSGETIALASGASVTGNGLVGITMSDWWRLTANTTPSNPSFITSNWERVDSPNSGFIGTGLTESSGEFSFPSTGIYEIIAIGQWRQTQTGTTRYVAFYPEFSTDSGSTFDREGVNYSYFYQASASAHYAMTTHIQVIDITNTSTFRMKFEAENAGDGASLLGATNSSETYFVAKRLGDT